MNTSKNTIYIGIVFGVPTLMIQSPTQKRDVVCFERETTANKWISGPLRVYGPLEVKSELDKIRTKTKWRKSPLVSSVDPRLPV